jgi:hypothetical protein
MLSANVLHEIFAHFGQTQGNMVGIGFGLGQGRTEWCD